MVWAVVKSELETLKLLSQYLPARTVVNRLTLRISGVSTRFEAGLTRMQVITDTA